MVSPAQSVDDSSWDMENEIDITQYLDGNHYMPLSDGYLSIMCLSGASGRICVNVYSQSRGNYILSADANTVPFNMLFVKKGFGLSIRTNATTITGSYVVYFNPIKRV